MTDMLAEIGRPYHPFDRSLLINLLKANNHDSLWGDAIRRTFEKDGDVDKLIAQLASQTMDDPFVMCCIVGRDAMVLLLRSVPH